MDIKEYKKYAENRSKRTSSLKNCVLAFIGGVVMGTGFFLSGMVEPDLIWRDAHA